MRFIYLTSDFLGSAVTLHAVAEGARPHEMVALMISDHGRSVRTLWSDLRFFGRVLKGSGVRYAAYLALLGKGYRVLDRMAGPRPGVPGRSRGIPLEEVARRIGVPIVWVDSINSRATVDRIRELAPDFILSVFFDRLLGREVLGVPRHGCLNVHNALLPRYAGAGPTVAALAAGEERVGVTLHYMNEDFDAGDIVAQTVYPVRPGDSVAAIDNTLLTREGVRLLRDAFRAMGSGRLPARSQDHRQRSYCTHPDRSVLRRLRRNGHRLATLRDLLRLAAEERRIFS